MRTNKFETAESGSGKNKSRRRSSGRKCARIHFDGHAGKNGPRWIHAARRRRQQPRRIVQHPPRKIDAKKEVDTARRRAYLFFAALFPWGVFRGGVFRGRLFRGSHPGPAAGGKIAPRRRCCLDRPRPAAAPRRADDAADPHPAPGR